MREKKKYSLEQNKELSGKGAIIMDNNERNHNQSSDSFYSYNNGTNQNGTSQNNGAYSANGAYQNAVHTVRTEEPTRTEELTRTEEPTRAARRITVHTARTEEPTRTAVISNSSTRAREPGMRRTVRILPARRKRREEKRERESRAALV